MRIGGVFFGVLWALLGISPNAQAYPNAIAMDYPSCINCHYHPAGDGILTDYGRTIGVNSYSAKPFWAPNTKEEDIQKFGDFLFPGFNSIQKYIRPQLNYRGLEYWTNFNAPKPIAPQYINMEADASVVVRANDDNTLFVAAALGRVPMGNGQNSWISRYHYLAYRPTDAIGFYVGLMDITYGIKIPDHIAFSREETGLAENDQAHSFLFHYLKENYEIFAQGFLGNLSQEADLRQKGGSLMAEAGATQEVRYGASFLYSTNDYRKRILSGLHARIKISDGSAILAEGGMIRYIPFADPMSTGFYGLLQPSFKIVRGFYALMTAEVYSQDWIDGTPRLVRFTPGFQWFLIPKVELRTEMSITRTLGQALGESDPLNLMVQVSAWL